MSAVSIGALRSARRQGEPVQRCCLEMHHAIEALGMDAFVTAIVALWEPAVGTFTWTNCGHLNPLLARDGQVRELTGERTYPLGIIEHERTFVTSSIGLRSGDRLLLYSDGIVEARLQDGSRYGPERLTELLTSTAGEPPSVAVAAIERDVTEATAGDVRDDATQLLLAVD
jgi:serine phosphatase RsbU (regulator of sigma subunit)